MGRRMGMTSMTTLKSAVVTWESMAWRWRDSAEFSFFFFSVPECIQRRYWRAYQEPWMYYDWGPQSQDQSRHWLWRVHAVGSYPWFEAQRLKNWQVSIAQVTNIFKSEMKKAGHKLNNNLCVHFGLTRVDLFHIVKVKKLRDFGQIMEACGIKKDAVGCEICKPAIGSILSSL
jgi:hypothetical protein